MKTIEQAAIFFEKENSEKVWNAECEKEKGMPGTKLCIDSFIAGAEFAQRWISVAEELPETGISVLILTKSNHVGMACRRYGDWDYKFANTITHWRPITVK